jgi:predicted permease
MLGAAHKLMIQRDLLARCFGRAHALDELGIFASTRFPMRSFWQDLRYAARTLRNSPSFTILAVVTLGLGMAVNTTIFSVINGLLLRPLPVTGAEQIVVLGLRQAGTPGNQRFSYPDYEDIRDQADSFSDVFAYRPTLVRFAVDGQGNHSVMSGVSGNYFSGLGIKPALGRLILPSEGHTPGADSIVVLGYSYWKKRFAGAKDVIGKQVTIGNRPATIVGVAPEGFRGTYSLVDMDGYIPLNAPLGGQDDPDRAVKLMWTERGDRSLTVMARLMPGVSVQQARTTLSVVAQRIQDQHTDVDKGLAFGVYPEKLARPEPDTENTLPIVAVAFTALAGLVMLVACFNLANVLLVRATVRQREMGIRAALGAGRGRLVRQHLTESLLLALLGGAMGFVLASWAAGFLSALPLGTDLPISFEVQPDARVYFFALSAALLTGLVVGIIPALRVARSDVNVVLREGGRGASDGKRRYFVRNALVVAQLAGSMLLLIVAGLFLRSLGNAQKTYLGFNPDHVLNLSMDVQQAGLSEAQGREFYRQLDERISVLPGVVSVAQAFSIPMGVISSDDPVVAEGHALEAGKQPPTVMFNPVTRDYFRTLQMPLKSGRTFTKADSQKAPKVAVINETMAKKFWPNEQAEGKYFTAKISSGDSRMQVIGILQDARYKHIVEDPEAFFYVPLEQMYMEFRTVHVRTVVPPRLLATEIEAEIHQLAPGVSVTQVQTMSESLNGLNGFFFFRFGAQLSGTMGLLGLILAIVGVYSVVSYAASQRTHEIGIRMALGADPNDILTMMLGHTLAVIGIGVLTGVLVALAGTRAIASLLVGVSASDPITFVGVVLLLSSVALLACWIPARRATRVSPLLALRRE